MFTEQQGPTALRMEMIRALAFSVSETSVSLDGAEEEPWVSGLVGVWNGERGFVAFLLRSLTRPEVRRFAFEESIRSFAELDRALESGMDFAAGLGFVMDDPDFSALPESERDARLERWNHLRKSELTPLAELDLTDPAVETADGDTATAASGASPSNSEDSGSGAVLGRVALVRQRERPGGRSAIGRLLGFF
ncbi:MAG: hypothetical protein ACE5FG_13035 [Myxococcota bacterium]